MNKTFKRLGALFLLLLALSVPTVNAQRVALKTNALYWATGTANLGAEFRVSRMNTINLEVAYNPFTFGDTKLETFAIYPEVRHWFAGRPQARFFVGVMGVAGRYNWSIDKKDHHGDALGLGVTGGYSWVLSKRWSLETNLGLGYVHLREREVPAGNPVPTDFNKKKNMFIPLKAGVTFVYIIK